MESVNQLELVKFFLHVESFKASFDALGTDPNSLDHIKTDASNVFSQYLANGAPSSIGLSDSIKKRTVEAICPKNGNIKSDCFDEAQAYVLDSLENRYYKEFLTSVFYSKFLLELCSAGLNIYDILGTHTILCAFLEYLEILEDDHGQNLLEFIINVRDSEQAKGTDPETLVEDAMVIYDKYFSMQATNNLNFGDEIRIEIESKICTENGLPEKDIFEKPYNTACSELQNKYVPAFLNSSPLQKVISQLSSFIEYHIDSPANSISAAEKNKKSRSSSTTSPTSVSPRWSFPSKNRLRLQSFDKSIVDGSDDGTEDTVSQGSGGSNLTQNNWKNNSLGCLAQIDEMGRYKPLFNKDVCVEELPGRGRLRSALDKYLNQSAAKENEMADEVAKLIIGDIQQMVSASNMAKKYNHV
ncbi:hypothetical protein FO519_007597 [Halicephalobus sp. NKZ332]|nr:hypothetical protein FO519_007597 [Halicephalobus sp. NKZ332]